MESMPVERFAIGGQLRARKEVFLLPPILWILAQLPHLQQLFENGNQLVSAASFAHLPVEWAY
jgi:hypothetical protein